MQRTECGDYINSTSSSSNDEDARKTEKPSRDSVLGVGRVVGVFLGLLCVLQATLNISLRLHKTYKPSFSSSCAPNTTTDWAIEDLVSMRYQLIGQRQQLHKAYDDLEANFRDCSQFLGTEICNPHEYYMEAQERDALKDQISQQRNLVMELERQRSRLLMHISKLDPSIPRCPTDWISEHSSCYLLSARKDTWDMARQDCLKRGAHLVTVNSQREQLLILTVGFLVDRVWIGLQSRSGDRSFTWEDGTPQDNGYSNANHFSEFRNRKRVSCAYLDQQVTDSYGWSLASCENMNHWLCEKTPK